MELVDYSEKKVLKVTDDHTRLTWGSSSGRVRRACRGHPPAPKRFSSAPRSPWPIPGSSRCGEERLRRVGAWEGWRQSKYLGDTATRLGLASRSGLDRSGVCDIDGLARPVCSVRPRLWTCSRSKNPSREAMDDPGQSPARPTGWEGGLEIGRAGKIIALRSPPKGMFRVKNWVHAAAPAKPTMVAMPMAPPVGLIGARTL